MNQKVFTNSSLLGSLFGDLVARFKDKTWQHMKKTTVIKTAILLFALTGNTLCSLAQNDEVFVGGFIVPYTLTLKKTPMTSSGCDYYTKGCSYSGIYALCSSGYQMIDFYEAHYEINTRLRMTFTLDQHGGKTGYLVWSESNPNVNVGHWENSHTREQFSATVTADMYLNEQFQGKVTYQFNSRIDNALSDNATLRVNKKFEGNAVSGIVGVDDKELEILKTMSLRNIDITRFTYSLPEEFLDYAQNLCTENKAAQQVADEEAKRKERAEQEAKQQAEAEPQEEAVNKSTGDNSVKAPEFNLEEYEARSAAERRAKEEQIEAQMEHVQETASQMIDLTTSLINEWSEQRDRRWAAEREAYRIHQTELANDIKAYNDLVTSTNAFLSEGEGKNFIQIMKNSLPHFYTKKIAWEDILGTSDYNIYFGKDIDFISKKTRGSIMGNSLNQAFNWNQTQKISLPGGFIPQDLTLVNYPFTFFYWVNNDFYDHNLRFIFDNTQKLVGVRINLLSSSQTEKIHIKDYYDNLIATMQSGYLMFDGNTYVTSDKIIVLDFDYLTIFDVNYLDPNTFHIYDLSCPDCIPGIGAKIAANTNQSGETKDKVVISSVISNSNAERCGLRPGDIILKINDYSILHPSHAQAAAFTFYENEKERSLAFEIKRSGKIETLIVTF